MINIIEEKCKLSNIERASNDLFLHTKKSEVMNILNFIQNLSEKITVNSFGMMFVLQSNSV